MLHGNQQMFVVEDQKHANTIRVIDGRLGMYEKGTSRNT